jgi:ABC-2 type transport system ATP-binding protein
MPLVARNIDKYFGGTDIFGQGLSRARRLLPWARNGNENGKNGNSGPVQVLHGVSFDIYPGEIFGLIGANGSGKSTLIRILSTLLLPDGGDVRVFGLDVVGDSGKVRALINRVSADPSFFRNMSALENLLFFGRVYGVAPPDIRRKVPEILGRLGFEKERAFEPMSHLSRGQQQGRGGAVVLTSPILMLLDEPTTGLDPRSKRDVQAFIRQVQQEHGATILLTTHDMEEAEILCDRISFIAAGRIVAEARHWSAEPGGEGQAVEEITMENVFMELTGRSIDEDEEALASALV